MASTIQSEPGDTAALAAIGAAVVAAQVAATGAALMRERTESMRSRGLLSDMSVSLRVLDLAQQTADRVSALSDASPDRERRACAAGCSWCCHVAVSITPPEALLIAERLRTTRGVADLAEVRAKIAERAEQVSALTLEERARAKIPCALLGADGACTIYEFRPIGCRGWNSLSAEACQRAFESGVVGHNGGMDSMNWIVAGCATEGLERGLREAGVDAGQYELHGAVLRALDERAALSRWADGEPVFAGCGRVTSERLLPSARTDG